MTTRLGLFSQGAAFERASGDVEVYPWHLARLFLTRGHFLANWVQGPKDAAGLGEDNELERDQARALVGYPSGRTWELDPEVRGAIGLEKG